MYKKRIFSDKQDDMSEHERKKIFAVAWYREVVYSASQKAIWKRKWTIIFCFIGEFNIVIDRVHDVKSVINQYCDEKCHIK